MSLTKTDLHKRRDQKVLQHVIYANGNKSIPRQMVRVQKQVAAPLKGRHGRLEVGRKVAEGTPCHSFAVGGASLDRSLLDDAPPCSGSAPPPRER